MQSAKREEELKELQQMQQQCTPNEAPFIQQAITACKKRENLRVLQEATVIGATCNATTFEVFEGLQFPIVFLDECSRQIEPLSLLPLRLGCKRAVLVGDPMQLPPTIALVLALHAYKPTPFYVMDEIDAALDWRNFSIIAAYLKERASLDAQFVVISLRSAMFEVAQQMVGVYKQRNCSQVVVCA